MGKRFTRYLEHSYEGLNGAITDLLTEMEDRHNRAGWGNNAPTLYYVSQPAGGFHVSESELRGDDPVAELNLFADHVKAATPEVVEMCLREMPAPPVGIFFITEGIFRVAPEALDLIKANEHEFDNIPPGILGHFASMTRRGVRVRECLAVTATELIGIHRTELAEPRVMTTPGATTKRGACLAGLLPDALRRLYDGLSLMYVNARLGGGN